MPSNAALPADEVSGRPAVEVRNKRGFKGVYALQPVSQHSVIFYLRGDVVARPSKYTIQLGSNEHLTFPAKRKRNDVLDYCWQYLNHCCAPNGYINTAERSFRALRDIAPGEEITFNYLTTESEMAMPFDCNCGSANCFGFIQGRNFLTLEQADRLALMFGEDNVVALLLPAVRGVGGDLRNSQPGS